MKASKRALIIALTTLVVLFASVFLFGEKAHAQEMPRPLKENEQIITQQSKVVADKSGILAETQTDILELESKKTALAQQLESVKGEVENLKQELAEKKAAAEAERKRVEEIKKRFVYVDKYAAGSAGNTYAAGNCTWYAKSRRPDLPNNLGNANTWYSRAQAQGWNVGSTPKKGAIGTSTSGRVGHVVYVEGVSLDGEWVTISEMNYGGLYRMNTRTVHYTQFSYIYELN